MNRERCDVVAATVLGKGDRGASRAAPAAVVLQPYAANVPGELIRTTNGKWITLWGGRGSNPRPTDYESAALTD